MPFGSEQMVLPALRDRTSPIASAAVDLMLSLLSSGVFGYLAAWYKPTS